jgi:hypothetical protein
MSNKNKITSTTYESSGVNYNKIDPIKVFSQVKAKETSSAVR